MDIRELVDYLCRDGAHTLIVHVHSKPFFSLTPYFLVIKRNEGKTQMQSTHFHTLGFGNSDDMMNMPCLIMQYKPYIVEQPPRKLL